MFIKRRSEGEKCINGINWLHDKSTDFGFVIKVWRFYWFFRRRSLWIMEGNNWKCKRNLFHFNYNYPRKVSGIEYDWDTLSIKVHDKIITLELLERLTEQDIRINQGENNYGNDAAVS